MAEIDLHAVLNGVVQWAERECGSYRTNWINEDMLRDIVVAAAPLIAARARASGFAEAVAMLRDDDRYHHWWSGLPPQDPAYGYWQAPARKHLADYLETIKLPLPSASRPPAAEGESRIPCPEGFHWIGQSFAFCDKCGLPSWDHDGMAVASRPLSPWEPDRRERLHERWGAAAEVRATADTTTEATA